MTMTMDEDENGPTNGSLQPQSMICSSNDFNSGSGVTSSTGSNATTTTTSTTCPNLTGDIRLGFSQVKGTLEDDVADGGLDYKPLCDRFLNNLFFSASL